jgi:1-phosphofructokinase
MSQSSAVTQPLTTPAAEAARPEPALAVVAPALELRVTIEPRADGTEDVHVHGGGQGFWVARMAARLGARVILCAPLGGEPGEALRGLIESESIEIRAVEASEPSGVRVAVRRGEREETLAHVTAPAPDRHELDDLFGVALAAGLEAGRAVLTGPRRPAVLPADLTHRLSRDLRANGVAVVADLSGPELAGALQGGPEVVKISHEELTADGYAPDDSLPGLLAGLEALQAAGAGVAIVSRRDEPTIVRAGARVLEVAGPRFDPRNPLGAGDAKTAALAVALAREQRLEDALRLAAAAGALNVTRRGLGTGRLEDIEAMAERVEVRELGGPSGSTPAQGT